MKPSRSKRARSPQASCESCNRMEPDRAERGGWAGWLINIENPLPVELLPNLLLFLRFAGRPASPPSLPCLPPPPPPCHACGWMVGGLYCEWTGLPLHLDISPASSAHGGRTFLHMHGYVGAGGAPQSSSWQVLERGHIWRIAGTIRGGGVRPEEREMEERVRSPRTAGCSV